MYVVYHSVKLVQHKMRSDLLFYGLFRYCSQSAKLSPSWYIGTANVNKLIFLPMLDEEALKFAQFVLIKFKNFLLKDLLELYVTIQGYKSIESIYCQFSAYYVYFFEENIKLTQGRPLHSILLV